MNLNCSQKIVLDVSVIFLVLKDSIYNNAFLKRILYHSNKRIFTWFESIFFFYIMNAKGSVLIWKAYIDITNSGNSKTSFKTEESKWPCKFRASFPFVKQQIWFLKNLTLYNFKFLYLSL